MADVKISALSEQSTPVSDDVLVMVETATTTSKKVEIGNIIKGRADEIVGVTASSKVFALSDANTFQRINSASAQTLQIPKNTTVNFPIGTRITLARQGAGVPTIQGATGVTLVSANSNVTISPQYGCATIIKISANVWFLFGDIA
tara:strand:+ start:4419 stop:4856 length:438 start_codon:yes stop_codon:yes gene_type:complete